MIIVLNEKYDGTVEEVVVVEREDGSFISMTKAHWDELQAKQTEGGLI